MDKYNTIRPESERRFVVNVVAAYGAAAQNYTAVSRAFPPATSALVGHTVCQNAEAREIIKDTLERVAKLEHIHYVTDCVDAIIAQTHPQSVTELMHIYVEMSDRKLMEFAFGQNVPEFTVHGIMFLTGMIAHERDSAWAHDALVDVAMQSLRRRDDLLTEGTLQIAKDFEFYRHTVKGLMGE